MLARLQNIIVCFSIIIVLFSLHLTLFTGEVLAVCPVCTIAVGAGLGISRALGIDDAVTSVWIGGLILSMSFWMIDWLEKRFQSKYKSKKKLFSTILFLSIFILTLVPLWYGKFIGRANNSLWGIDKIIFGTFCGSLAFIIGKWADAKVREVKGKQLFIYQKVVFPVASLLLLSIILDIIITKFSL